MLGSASTKFSFSRLSMGPGILYGGLCTLPGGGLDMFKVAKFKPVAGSLISFGQEPGGGAHRAARFVCRRHQQRKLLQRPAH